MSSIEKLIEKARTPKRRKNLTFEEALRLCEYFGCTVKPGKGSHVAIHNDAGDILFTIRKPHKGHDKRLDPNYSKKIVELLNLEKYGEEEK